MNRICGYSKNQKYVSCSKKINREDNPKIEIVKLIDSWKYEDIYLITFNDIPSSLRISKFKISERELCHQNIASEYSISLKIYDYWTCSSYKYYAVVTEKEGNITLSSLIKLIKNDSMLLIDLILLIYKKICLLNFVCNIIHFNLDVESVTVYYNNKNIGDIKIMDFQNSYKLSEDNLEDFIDEKLDEYTNLSISQKIIFSDLIGFFSDLKLFLLPKNNFLLVEKFIDEYIFGNLRKNPEILILNGETIDTRIDSIRKCFQSSLK